MRLAIIYLLLLIVQPTLAVTLTGDGIFGTHTVIYPTNATGSYDDAVALSGEWNQSGDEVVFSMSNFTEYGAITGVAFSVRFNATGWSDDTLAIEYSNNSGLSWQVAQSGIEPVSALTTYGNYSVNLSNSNIDDMQVRLVVTLQGQADGAISGLDGVEAYVNDTPDTTAPNITLLNPINRSEETVLFTYTPIDEYLDNCTLWGNWSGWSAKVTKNATSNETNNFTQTLPLGDYVWAVACSDKAGNSAFSENRTLQVLLDLFVKDLSLDASPVEDAPFVLLATVENTGLTARTVTVQFWDGNPITGIEIGNKTLLVLGGSTNTTNVTHNKSIGVYNLSVVIDPQDNVTELNETNNTNILAITVPLWKVFFGNTTSNFTLDTQDNKSVFRWLVQNNDGNIFISDKETTNDISFASLVPFGKNTTQEISGQTTNDFEELDATMNTTAFADSVNATYTSSGSPIAVRDYNITNKTIVNVPIINSTDSGVFATGLLWDADDSLNAYYEGIEDVVFVAELQTAVNSTNGVVDYEIIVPAWLRKYQNPQTELILYFELR